MHQPVRIALICTYPEISTIFNETIASRDDIIGYDVFASFDDAVIAAREIEHKIDIILSRGGTGEYIKRNVDVPVVQLPITPFDVVLAMQKLPQGLREFALSHVKEPIYGLNEIQTMYGVSIHEYTFENFEELEQNVAVIREKGISHVVGGQIVGKIAQAQGITHIPISAGLDTVKRAIHESLCIVLAARKERNRATQLAAAFNAITSGLIVTDSKNEVLLCNPVADKLFSCQYPVGGRFTDEQADAKSRLALKKNAPQSGSIRKIHDTFINTNHLPVYLDKECIGFVHTFEDVTKIQNLEQAIRKQMHAKGFVARYHFEDILTCNPTLQMIKHNAESYAQSRSAVHIEGESGTGKELFAQSVHNASPRADMPFVAVNCAAIPASLLESELFGYEAGAFTGARKEGRQGLFEIAHNGTIFLDEIGDLPKELQARLLRVLQEKELMRVGGDKVIPVDVRIISATNKNLQEMATRGEFREDLFYRLSVFNITIPPLRERRCDIEPLCRKFLADQGISAESDIVRLFMPRILAHNWRGNVRELHNISERLAHLVRNAHNSTQDQLDLALGLCSTSEKPDFLVSVDLNRHHSLKSIVDHVEWKVIDHLLKLHNKKYAAVAERLGIGRTSLWRKYRRTGADKTRADR